MTQKLLVIDGHSWAFRAFYALPADNFATKTGQATNAVYGFVTMLLGLLSRHRPSHIGVAFDRSRHSFRTDIFPDYKAGRGETPQAFIGQVPLIKEVLDAIGIRHLDLEGFEADDIMATWSTNGRQAGLEVLVASGDRDTFQLIEPGVSVLYPQFRSSEMSQLTRAEVEAKYGVTPEQYPDLAALVGEQSDNLPGVPGVGPKTAAKWIQTYGSLAGIEANAAQLTGKVGQSLRDHLDQVHWVRELNALRRDLDLPVGVAELVPGEIDRPSLDTLFDALEFGRLRARVLQADYWSGHGAGPTEPEEDSPWRPPGLIKVARGRLGGFLAGPADEGGPPWGLAVDGHVGKGQGEAEVLALARPDGAAVVLGLTGLGQEDEVALTAWLANPKVPKALHQSKTARHQLAGRGWQLEGVVFDPALAAYLCLPDRRGLDLAGLAQHYLAAELAEGPAQGAQGALDLDAAGDEATNAAGAQLGAQGQVWANRAAAAAALAVPLNGLMAAQAASSLFEAVEMPLVPVLAQMEATGIAVDRMALELLQADLQARALAAKDAAYQALGGQEVNLASPKALQTVLFEQLGMPKTKRIKTGYSTNAASLAELFVKTGHPFLEHLLAHRDVTKIGQMVSSLIDSIGEDERIHTTFSQTAAATGRLASADPNLQNIPVRTETGQRVREAFVAGAGFEDLMTADYSQIEMRIMAHLSGDEALIEAFRQGEDLHATMAATVFAVKPEAVTSAQRSRIKAMSYGLAYGLSAYGLSRQLGISPGEAEDLMDDYFRRFGGVRDLLAGIVEQARRNGYTETIMGRRRYLPDLTSTNRQRREMAERAALNAPIQGSAADIVKVAMLRVEAALDQQELASRMLLQVHDELVCEVATGEAAAMEALLNQEMGAAAELSVPLAVSVGRGSNWRTAAH
ncbi:MAG: DNA polymerase I [Micrococcales bacterium]|nr:DNA polymerase I [Micrococcales bacterium]